MKKSETLVILGSGPSLRGFDFRRLRRFDVIGMNVAYRHWDEIGWYPKYYICLDPAVGVSHKQEIARLIRETEQNGIKVFVLRRDLIELLPDDIRDKGSILDFDALRKTIPIFRKTQPITTGSHSTIIGAMFGYRQMFLLGIDCNYVERVEGAIEQEGTVLKMEKTPRQNPNYFFDRYQIAGDKYHTPNSSPDLHLKAWDVAARVLGEHGIEVWNGSSTSAVKNFPFLDFSELEKRVSHVRQWFQAISCWKTPLPENDRDTTIAAPTIDDECIGAPEQMLYRVVAGVYDQMLRPHGIRSSQMNILTVVCLHGPISLAHIEQRLAIEEPYLRTDVELMEKNGWIESRPVNGSNLPLLGVTQEGSQLFNKSMPAWHEAQARLRKLLGDEVTMKIREEPVGYESVISCESKQLESGNHDLPVVQPFTVGKMADINAIRKPKNAA